MSVQPNKMELPEDRTTKLFVLSMASNFVMLKMFTKTVYELETANQEINSLSNLPRDVEKAKWRGIAALKRHYGNIADIPSESIFKRPPNWFLILTITLVGAGLIAYGQYNPSFSQGIVNYWNQNSAYIIVGVLLFFALILFLRFRRRRKVSG